MSIICFCEAKQPRGLERRTKAPNTSISLSELPLAGMFLQIGNSHITCFTKIIFVPLYSVVFQFICCGKRFLTNITPSLVTGQVSTPFIMTPIANYTCKIPRFACRRTHKRFIFHLPLFIINMKLILILTISFVF